MKNFLFLFMFLLMSSSVMAVCYNQNDLPFCSKDDPTCMQEGDEDADHDGWSDLCDAFPENELFHVDYDGDLIGYGTLVYDCNDVDDSILTYCGDTSLLDVKEHESAKENKTNEEEGNALLEEDSSGNSSGDEEPTQYDDDTHKNESTQDDSEEDNQEEETKKTSSGSHTSTQRSSGSSGTLLFADPNNNIYKNNNDEDEEEPSDEVTLYNNPPLPDTLPPSNSPEDINFEEEEVGNQITGAVIGGGFTSSWPLWTLLLIVVFMLFLVWERRRDSE